jgi:hypothetical protein
MSNFRSSMVARRQRGSSNHAVSTWYSARRMSRAFPAAAQGPLPVPGLTPRFSTP